MRNLCKEILKRMVKEYPDVVTPDEVDSWTNSDVEYFYENYKSWLDKEDTHEEI